MPTNESPKQVRFVESGPAQTVEAPSRGTAKSTDKDTTRVVSTPAKQKVASPSRRGEGLWRVPFLI